MKMKIEKDVESVRQYNTGFPGRKNAFANTLDLIRK